MTRCGGALLVASLVVLPAACANSAADAPPEVIGTIALGELPPQLAVATSPPPTTVTPTTDPPPTTRRPRRTTTEPPTTPPPSTVPPTTPVPPSSGPPPVTSTAPSVPTTSPPTTIPMPVDPRTLTAADVQDLLDELMARERDAYEIALRTGRTAPEMMAFMQRADTEDQAVRTITGFEEFGGVDILLDPPGRPIAELLRINAATSECLSITSTFDLQPLTFKPIEDVEQPFDMRLLMLDPDEDPTLPWRLDWVRSTPGDAVPVIARCPTD